MIQQAIQKVWAPLPMLAGCIVFACGFTWWVSATHHGQREYMREQIRELKKEIPPRHVQLQLEGLRRDVDQGESERKELRREIQQLKNK